MDFIVQDGMLSHSKLLALLNHLQDAVFAIEEGRFVFVNSQTTRLFGYAEEELIGQPITNFIFEDDRALVLQRYQARQRGEPVPDEYTFRIVTKTGEILDVRMRVGTVAEQEGVITSIGSLQDITEHKRTRAALAHTQADIASILNNMSDVFYRTDMQGIVMLMSPSSLDNIGYAPEEMIGRPLSNFYCDPAERQKVVQALVEAEGRAIQVESRLRHKNGSPVWVNTNAYIRFDENKHPLCIEGIAREITERKVMEERLTELVKYDDLTRLFNRRHFLGEAQKQTEIAQRYHRPLSLMMLDLDWFKTINDDYSHQMGDRALSHFAAVCRSIFRKTDLIGRLGGEEFGVLMPETAIGDAMELAERFRQQLAIQPLLEGPHTIELTFSAGLVCQRPGDKHLDDLLKRADSLLYSAKKSGRNRIICAPD